MDILIHPESPKDAAAISQVNHLAFNRENEAILVERLRQNNAITLSLVAEQDGQILGHILFSPVTITDGEFQWQAIGLRPMAVMPEFQHQGIGSALIRAGLDELKKRGQDVVIVLGHPEYYPRFGFRPSKPFGIQWEVNVPDEVFMVAELSRGSLNGRTGIVRYHSAFKDV